MSSGIRNSRFPLENTKLAHWGPYINHSPPFIIAVYLRILMKAQWVTQELKIRPESQDFEFTFESDRTQEVNK